MNGQVTVTSERGNVRTRQIQQGPGTETNNPYLQGVYINNNTINVAVLDALLFNFLDFLKQLVGDPGYGVQFVVNGYESTAFKYKAMRYDQMELIDNYEDPDNSLHVDLLNIFWRVQDFRFTIENTTTYDLQMKGNFLAMFGLNPNTNTHLASGGFLEAHLPVYGHNYICLTSNIGSNSLSSTCGECLQTANLFAVIPSPNYAAQ